MQKRYLLGICREQQTDSEFLITDVYENPKVSENVIAFYRPLTIDGEPDLILLDYEMPVCSGQQFLEMIRAEVSTSMIPVIFLTAKGDKESVKSVLALKPAGYLLKTMAAEQIVESIDNFFEKNKAKS